MSGPLTNDRHEKFAQGLVLGETIDAAYANAGFKPHRSNACRLSANDSVRKRVDELRIERSQRTRIDADWVLQRLAEEAEADVADLYDDDGNLKPIRQWPMVWRKGLIAGIETIPEKVGTDEEGKPIYRNGMRIKLADRGRVKELLGKHVYVSAFREKVDHTSSDGSMSPPSLADFYGALAETSKGE